MSKWRVNNIQIWNQNQYFLSLSLKIKVYLRDDSCYIESVKYNECSLCGVCWGGGVCVGVCFVCFCFFLFLFFCSFVFFLFVCYRFLFLFFVLFCFVFALFVCLFLFYSICFVLFCFSVFRSYSNILQKLFNRNKFWKKNRNNYILEIKSTFIMFIWYYRSLSKFDVIRRKLKI